VSFCKLERAVALQNVPTERVNEINEYIMLETLHQAMGSVEDIKKYYDQRYRLFSKFDRGIRLDTESWFSITPECISIDIADKCQSQAVKHNVRIGMIVDCFCGVGGNVISMAGRVDCQVVFACDIDRLKLEMLRCNAEIYGVASRVECVNEDAYNMIRNFSELRRRLQFFREESVNISDALRNGTADIPSHQVQEGTAVTDTTPLPQLNIPKDQPPGGEVPVPSDNSPLPVTQQSGWADILVLAPPWGGVDYTNTNSAFDIRTMITSGDGVDLFERAAQVFSNIIYILPKNTKKKDLLMLAQHSKLYCRVEDVHIHNKLKMIVAYFGPLFAPYSR